MRNESKPLCALIHGWGMPAFLFDPLKAKISPRFEVIYLRLPGDEGLGYNGETSLADYARAIALQIPRKAVICGWSFGGMIALQFLSLYPKLVEKVILLSSTPKFIRDKSWEYGVDKRDFDEFARSFKLDYHKTLQKFLTLQSMYMPDKTATARLLRARKITAPEEKALASQLNILKTVDLRNVLHEINNLTIWFMGGNDRLVLPGAGRFAANAMPNAKAIVFAETGHMPFWSHAGEIGRLMGC